MWWEIETNDSYTPGRIGDHIIIIKANSMEEALKIFANNRGKTTLKGKPIVMILDHIDGNAANNVRENYRCICPNCDSQLDTFKSRNRHSARTYRYNKIE